MMLLIDCIRTQFLLLNPEMLLGLQTTASGLRIQGQCASVSALDFAALAVIEHDLTCLLRREL